jgi:hypothetical protein
MLPPSNETSDPQEPTMDLYTRTTLTNTRHHDLLAEATAARLAASDKDPGTHAIVPMSALTGFVARLRAPRLTATAREAHAHS